MANEDFFPELPKLNKVLCALNEINAFNPHDGAGWELRKLRWYRDALFENYAPFKVGDRLVMHTAYPVGNSGWSGYWEMMQPGARGLVKRLDWTADSLHHKDAKPGSGCFVAYIQFDKEWWLSRDGRRYREEDHHTFPFNSPERFWERDTTPKAAETFPVHDEASAA
jgi:hypothetical protein